MDDNTLHTQYMVIAKCINGLGVTLSETDGPGDISKIVTDVQKLVESFRLLGKYYVSELLQKYQELESKNRELEDLSRKLQQVELECHSGPSSVPRPDS